MAERLQIGLIGCGSQGQFLSEALTTTGQADLVACTDVNPEAAERVKKVCGYKQTYNDYGQMLSEAALDAVIIAVTHDYRGKSGASRHGRGWCAGPGDHRRGI